MSFLKAIKGSRISKMRKILVFLSYNVVTYLVVTQNNHTHIKNCIYIPSQAPPKTPTFSGDKNISGFES